MKAVERWFSERLQTEISLARWGDYGTPVLLFPTAGGDAEEGERNGVVDACGQLLADGRIKLFSVDSVAGRAMVAKHGDPRWRARLLGAFHDCVRREVVPAIHTDLGGQALPIIAAGASIGAFNAVAALCRYPDAFSAAVGMSGSYTIERFYEPPGTEELYYSAPLQFLPGLDGGQLDLLRQRFAILASGEGAWENISESWAMGAALGAKGIPNRVDNWGLAWEHEWPTWLRMLPQYLDELS